jgi:hypothetical protein
LVETGNRRAGNISKAAAGANGITIAVINAQAYIGLFAVGMACRVFHYYCIGKSEIGIVRPNNKGIG